MASYDYMHHFSAESFPPGSSDNATLCVNITIRDDSALEENETFSVTLTFSAPSVMVTNPTATITIIDNDGKFT